MHYFLTVEAIIALLNAFVLSKFHCCAEKVDIRNFCCYRAMNFLVNGIRVVESGLEKSLHRIKTIGDM